jgi:hypothetical protein
MPVTVTRYSRPQAFLRTAVRRGASWMAAYHLQLKLTVRRWPDPSVAAWVPSASLLLSGPGGARPDGVCPEERPAGIERSGVVAVVDTARGRPRRQSPVSSMRCPPIRVSGVRDPAVQPSGVRSPGVVIKRSGGRPSAVQPSGVQPSGVQPSGVCPVRPVASVSFHLRRWRWGLRSSWPGDRDHRNRWRPGGWRAGDGSTTVAEAGTRATLPKSRWSLGGRWRSRAAGLDAGRGRACP